MSASRSSGRGSSKSSGTENNPRSCPGTLSFSPWEYGETIAIGVPAFALIKILSVFYFARDNTKLPFYISLISMILNIIISVSLFKKYGFIIIPIATSFSTWVAVLIYFVLLSRNKFINFEKQYLSNFLKILLATIFMCLFLYFGLDYFEDKFEYSYKFKLIYLLIMVVLSAAIYLFVARFLGVLNLKSYKLK